MEINLQNMLPPTGDVSMSVQKIRKEDLAQLINNQFKVIQKIQIEALNNISDGSTDEVEPIAISTTAQLNLLSAARTLNII